MRNISVFLLILAIVSISIAKNDDKTSNYDLTPGVTPQPAPTTDDPWDLQFSYDDIVAQTGDNNLFGIAYDGQNIWISGRENGSTMYLFDPVTGLLEDMFVVETGQNINDMCFDGEKIYGGTMGGIVGFDIQTHSIVDTIPTGSSSLAVAYDPATDHFYCGYLGSTCHEIDRQGNIIRTWAPAPLTSVSGMAWDDAAPDGPWLWIHDQTTPATGCNIHQMDPVTLTLTGEVHLLNPPGSIGPIAGGLDFAEGLYTGEWSMLVLGQGTPDAAAAYEMWICGAPNIHIALTPPTLPVQIPPAGGVMNFAITVLNTDNNAFNVNVWTEITLPDGSIYGPIINAANRTLPSGAEILRNLSQNVPASAPPGEYIYHAKIGTTPQAVEDEDFFYFEKLAAGENEAIVKDWAYNGEIFEAPGIDTHQNLVPRTFPQTDDPFELLWVLTGGENLMGVEFDGDNLWLAYRGALPGQNIINIVNPWTGAFIEQFDQGAPSYWGVRDMCHDENFIYGGWDQGLNCYDLTTHEVLTTLPFPAGMSFPRANAYDPATDHFYCGNFGTTCYEMDRAGNLIRSWSSAPLTSVYGMAWDDQAPDGPWLWIMDATNPVSGCNLHQVDPVTLTLTGVFHPLNPPSVPNPMPGGVTHVTGLYPQFSTFLNSFGSGVACWEGYPPFASPTYDVSIELDPAGMPITIPASGGTFEFNIQVDNNDTCNVMPDIWSMVTLPNGDEYGPLLNVQNMTLPIGFSGNRDRTQVVPANAPPGNYTYDAYVGDYPNIVWDEDHFDFAKSAADNGGEIFDDWLNWGESFDDIGDDALETVETFALHDAHPNPFNHETQLTFTLPEAGEVSLKIFDISGREVFTLVDGMMPMGLNSVKWNASNMPSGIYFARLSYLPGAFSDRQHSSVKKLILLK